MPRQKGNSVFKVCCCGKIWKTRDDFLKDRKIRIMGYQPDFVNHRYNHFLFRHLAKGCGEYLGVRASDFGDLRGKACTSELCTGHEDCPGYCLNTFDLRVCSVTCRNASDRMLAAKLRNRRALRSLAKAVAEPRHSRGAGSKLERVV